MAEQVLEEKTHEEKVPAKAARKRWRAIATLLFFTALNIVLVVVLVSRLNTAQRVITGKATVPLVGHTAPDFTLKTWDGQTIRLSALKGKPVVLNFWASWCDPCKAEAKTLEDAWQRYRANGVIFLGINYQDQEQSARKFLQENGVTYPGGPDTSGQMSVDYGVSNVPATIIINSSGIVVWDYLGQIKDAQTLDNQIEPLLTPAVGG